MLTWITTMLPWIIGAVRWAEKFFGPGKGEDKLAAVLGLIGTSLPEEADPDARAKIIEGGKMVINGIVLIFNATGVFRKG